MTELTSNRRDRRILVQAAIRRVLADAGVDLPLDVRRAAARAACAVIETWLAARDTTGRDGSQP